MFTAISSELETKQAQAQFRNAYNLVNDVETITTNLGYQGGTNLLSVSYSPSLGMWWLIDPYDRTDAMMNIFGFGRPNNDRNTDTTVQINIPSVGLNGRFSGLFAYNSGNNIWVLHDGSINNTGSPILQREVLEQFADNVISINWGRRQRRLIAVGQIGSPNFLINLSNFVRNIHAIKHGRLLSTNSNNPQTTIPTPLTPNPNPDASTPSFNSEFFGERRYELSSTTVIATVNHGRIVEALNKRLADLGFRTANSRNIDLFTHSNELSEEYLFEVKTSINTQSVYTAVGQLMLHSVAQRTNVKKVFVAPEGLNSNLLNDLAILGIQVVSFGWEIETPVFRDLEKIIE